MARILVVDDDLDLAEMLGIVLTSSGFDVDLVNRGDEALEAFRNNPPDLVLLDVMLPGIDGIEVCTLIRKESVVPIVMLSAKGETLDIVRGLEAGADDYMQKPFRDEAELIARIRTRLRRTNADRRRQRLADGATRNLRANSLSDRLRQHRRRHPSAQRRAAGAVVGAVHARPAPRRTIYQRDRQRLRHRSSPRQCDP